MNELATTNLPEPMPDEPARWFDAFVTFCQLGSRRSVLAAFNVQREREGKPGVDRASSTWFDMAKRWDWRERAIAWDREQRARDAAWLEDRRVAIREKSIETLVAHLERLSEASETLDPEKAGWRDVGHGLRAVISELRNLTEGDVPKSGQGVLETVLAALPHGVKVQLLAQIERE